MDIAIAIGIICWYVWYVASRRANRARVIQEHGSVEALRAKIDKLKADIG